jgi:hypothetical protein
MTLTVDELLDRWPSDIPFKGKLITKDGCMCAQAQVLHYVGGMSADELRNIEQRAADLRTADLLVISVAHAVLLRHVNDSQPGAPACVIREPEQVIGANAQTILAFWRHLDEMTDEQWDAAAATARDAAWTAAGTAARDAARDAARTAAGTAARTAAWTAAWDAARDAARTAAWTAAGAAAWDAARHAAGAAAGATNEIQGAAVMRERGQQFFFLPMFGFESPEDII